MIAPDEARLEREHQQQQNQQQIHRLCRTLSCDIERKRHFSLWLSSRSPIAITHCLRLSITAVSSWALSSGLLHRYRHHCRLTCLLLLLWPLFPSFFLSPVVFTFEEVASKPSQGRRFLSRPPFLHIATNKASLWAEKRERERRAVLQIRHWHHCDDTYTHSQEKQIRSRRQQQQIAGAWWKSAGGWVPW